MQYLARWAGTALPNTRLGQSSSTKLMQKTVGEPLRQMHI